MKTKRPESDWELMQADSDIVEPKRKENNYDNYRNDNTSRPSK